MQVQLSLAALERLLGGDTELEIQLRHQVAAAFEEKHLKKLASNMAEPVVQRLIQSQIDDTVREMLDVEKLMEKSWPVVSNRLRRMISEEVDKQVQAALAEAIDRHITKRMPYIEQTITYRLGEETKRRCQEQVDRMFKDVMTRLSETVKAQT